MTEIYVVVSGAAATARKTGPVVAGTVGLPVHFSFSDKWAGLNIIAVFEGSGVSVSVPLLGTTSETVPWECLVKANTRLRIGAEGRKSDGSIVIPTVWADVGYIVGGAKATDNLAQEPSPTPFDRLMAAIGDLGSLSTREKSSLVAAVNETAKKLADTSVIVNDMNADVAAALGKADRAVSYEEAQELTPEQQARARENIGVSAGGTVDIVDDLDTKDSTVALSANMGNVLRNKIDNDLLTVEKDLEAQVKARVKTVNGMAPDANGNVEIPISDGSQNVYILAEGETPEDAPADSIIVIDPNGEADEDESVAVEDGGYYTPLVTQKDGTTATFSFTPSKEGMPAVADKNVTLPVGPTGPQGPAGADYALTEADKTEIAEMAAEFVDVAEPSAYEKIVDYTVDTDGASATAFSFSDDEYPKLAEYNRLYVLYKKSENGSMPWVQLIVNSSVYQQSKTTVAQAGATTYGMAYGFIRNNKGYVSGYLSDGVNPSLYIAYTPGSTQPAATYSGIGTRVPFYVGKIKMVTIASYTKFLDEGGTIEIWGWNE